MKKLMLPFLTEWLIKYGTNPIDMADVGLFNMEILYKAMRKNYLEQVSIGQPILMKITKLGVKFLQENQK